MNRPNKHLNLLLIFGGRSCEHAVSVSSARSVASAIGDASYRLQFIGISEQGHWRWADDDSIESLISDDLIDPHAGSPVMPDLNSPGRFMNTRDGEYFGFCAHVIFPLLHGPYGEDGTLQGLLEMFDVPYVGCGVLASACGMDKLVSKRLFEKAGIPQADYIEVSSDTWSNEKRATVDTVSQSLHYPLFVKPANMGSSVGISKVDTPDMLEQAIELALTFDHKVLVENGFENMLEVECAVLGNEHASASVVGEIRSGAEFYSYAAKYVEQTSSVIIPADISEAVSQAIQALAVEAFKAIDGSGLARVDFFVDAANGQVWLNEINTLPGFTPISMYPKLWQASGLPYATLIAKLIALAMARFECKKALRCSYTSS
jgi:D-alanine-D-alanine ligase